MTPDGFGSADDSETREGSFNEANRVASENGLGAMPGTTFAFHQDAKTNHSNVIKPYQSAI